MSRSSRPYAAGAETFRTFEGFSSDVPVAGFYRMPLRYGGVLVGIRIWNGPPHDPVTGEELDRSWRWQAEANGKPIDLERVWPRCARDPTDEAEYRFLTAKAAWATEHAPADPHANPYRRIDLMTAPTPF